MNPEEHPEIKPRKRGPEIHSPKTRKAPIAILLAVAAVLAVGFAGIAPRMATDRKLHDEVAQVRDRIPTVTTVGLKPERSSDEIVLPGNLQAIEETTINARTSGYVQARYVDIGSKVTAGQILAQIDSPEMDQQSLQAESEVIRANAGVGQARADVVRLQASIAGARSEYIRYQANVGQAKADLAHLRANYAQSQAALDVSRSKLTQASTRLVGVKAALTRANVEQDIAQKTLKRWKELEAADAVSGQEVDEKQSIYDSSQANRQAAEANVSTAEADVQAARETVRSQQAEVLAAEADIASGSQKIQAAKAALDSSQANIDAAIAAQHAGQSNVSVAQATVGANQANARRYSAMQSFEKVTAPFSGVITARNVDVGDLVNGATSGSGASDPTMTVTKSGLFGLARTDVLKAQAKVPEDQASGIKVGQLAVLTTQEFPARSFYGKVINVSGALDSSSRTLLVEVSVPNPLGVLKPGMFGQLHFSASGSRQALRIPANALLFDAKGTRVAVVTVQGTIHYEIVKLGRDFGDEIEVLEGLKGDEMLVVNPDDSMAEGQKVKALPSKK